MSMHPTLYTLQVLTLHTPCKCKYAIYHGYMCTHLPCSRSVGSSAHSNYCCCISKALVHNSGIHQVPSGLMYGENSTLPSAGVGPPASLTTWISGEEKAPHHHMHRCTSTAKTEIAHVYSECLYTLTCTCTCTLYTVHTVPPRHNLTHACACNARNVEVSHDNLYH